MMRHLVLTFVAIFTLTVVGFATQPSTAAQAPTPPAQPGRTPPSRVVVGSVEVHRGVKSGSLFAIVHPVVVYEHGKYQNAILSGNDVKDTQRLIHRSVLNQVKTFAVYLRGEQVAMMRIQRLDVTERPFSCSPGVVGVGGIRFERPVDFSGGDDGALYVDAQGRIDVSPPEKEGIGSTTLETRVLYFDAVHPGGGIQTFMAPFRELTSRERRRMLAAAGEKLKHIPNVQWPNVGRVMPRGDVALVGTKFVDVDRDRAAEVIATFKAPLRRPQIAPTPGEPEPNPEPAVSLLMVFGLRSGQEPKILLSLAALLGFDADSDNYQFETVVDANGDGVGEVLLAHVFHEAYRLELFGLQDDRFVRVFVGPPAGC